MYYLNNFFLFSVIGFIMETIINFILGNKLDSGFLMGPWTPVYGLGILIIILVNKILDRFKLNKYRKVIITFFINIILLTLIEFIGGYLIELVFNQTFWNYSGLPLHIGKYISLEISIIWGLLSLVYLYLIKNKTDKLIKKIPNYITYISLVLFIIDFIIKMIKTILKK